MNKKNVGTGIACQRKEKGITLIALIITIIVILILVAVSVRTVVNSGIFNHSKDATSKWADAQNKEANISIDDLITEYVDFSNIQYKIGEKDADGNYIVDVKVPEYLRVYGVLDPNDVWNALSFKARIATTPQSVDSGSETSQFFGVAVIPDFGPFTGEPGTAGITSLVKQEFAKQRTEAEKDLIAIRAINLMRILSKDGYKIERATNLSEAYKLFNTIWENDIINSENTSESFAKTLRQLKDMGIGTPEQARDIAYWALAILKNITNENFYDIALYEEDELQEGFLRIINYSNSVKYDSATSTYVPVEGFIPYNTFEEAIISEYNKEFETTYTSLSEIEQAENTDDWKVILERISRAPFEAIALEVKLVEKFVDFDNIEYHIIDDMSNNVKKRINEFPTRLAEYASKIKSTYESTNSPTTVYEIELEGFEKRRFTLEEMLDAFEKLSSDVQETKNEGQEWINNNLTYVQEDTEVKSELKLKITTNGIAKEYTIKTQI